MVILSSVVIYSAEFKFRSLLLFRLHQQTGAVDAIPFSGGRQGAVVKDVAKVAAAVGACYFHAPAAVGVFFYFDRARQGLVKAGPARAAVKLGIRRKKLPSADHAGEHALAVFVQKGRGKGPLRAFFAQNVVLLGGELLFELVIVDLHIFMEINYRKLL